MHTTPIQISIVLFCSLLVAQAALCDQLIGRLSQAGDNASELRRALNDVPKSELPGMEFLIAHMPDRDLRLLSAEFLLENVSFAYQARLNASWRDEVSEELFFNYVLPYASINERRDRWRADFYDKCLPLVKDAKSPSEAAATLNNKLFEQLGVQYSTKRSKADQSPLESIESGLASCTGLSVILIDACRSVGVPARFVGTPLWSDRSGNHSWVEIWDNGWHYTGAAEPAGMKLDDGWFSGRAAMAKRNNPLHTIYAASFQRTPLQFPCVWDRRVDYVSAVNVTDRYTSSHKQLPLGYGFSRFQVVDSMNQRIACKIDLRDAEGKVLHSGTTRDDRFDSNDHLTFQLPKGESFLAVVPQEGNRVSKSLTIDKDEQLFTIEVDQANAKLPPVGDPIKELKTFLSTPMSQRGDVGAKPFALVPLTKQQAAEAEELLWNDHTARIERERSDEMEARTIKDGDLEMPFAYKVFGDKPTKGRSLYISMHGGGGAPKQVNDQQWRNQQALYQPPEGVYLAPRAPTDAWNLWHQSHIDRLFDRLIENLIVLENVNPNRVYLMGYSAGGDGAYQLAPRMADRWAAVSMMAGHPNDTSPLGLRNTCFAIYMGGLDAAYKRNTIATEWKEKLAQLQEKDPNGYRHLVTIYPDKGHWMDREDASSIDWMRKQERTAFPTKIVWKQDDVTHRRFYWLATDEPKPGDLVVAYQDGATIDLQAEKPESLSVRLNDSMLNLDEPVRITSSGRVMHEGVVSRSIATLHKTLAERGDPTTMFSSEIDLSDQ